MNDLLKWWKSLSSEKKSLLEINFIFNHFPQETIQLGIDTGTEINIFEVFNDRGLVWNDFRNFCASRSVNYFIKDSFFKFKGLDIYHLKDLLISQYGDNYFDNYNFIGKLVKIKRLYAAAVELKSIDFIYPLLELQLIDISFNTIKDISVLNKFSDLQNLYLNNNDINSISSLIGLKNLQEITFKNNYVENIEPLTSCKNLKLINSFNNCINDSKKLVKLKNLEHLNLGLNQIMDISFIEQLPLIETLELSFNQIKDTSFIVRLSHLKYLNLYPNLLDKKNAMNLVQKGIKIIETEEEYNRYTESYLIVPYYSIYDVITSE